MFESSGCQHHRIDNETWKCIECGDRMISRTVEGETVLSAPNAAACNNPACQAALDNGTYDETNPPAGCTNPHGAYIPDHSRAREVFVGQRITYNCDRCHNDGTIMTRDYLIWECGKIHRGTRVKATA